MKTYLIIHISGCSRCQSSSTIALVKPDRWWQYGPRCPCGGQTMPINWSVLERVRATNQLDAFEKYHKRRIGLLTPETVEARLKSDPDDKSMLTIKAACGRLAEMSCPDCKDYDWGCSTCNDTDKPSKTWQDALLLLTSSK